LERWRASRSFEKTGDLLRGHRLGFIQDIDRHRRHGGRAAPGDLTHAHAAVDQEGLAAEREQVERRGTLEQHVHVAAEAALEDLVIEYRAALPVLERLQADHRGTALLVLVRDPPELVRQADRLPRFELLVLADDSARLPVR